MCVRRIREGGKKRRAFRTCEVERPLSTSSFTSRFPSFPHQGRSGGCLYTPLTMPRRALHTTRLFLQGVFSRECRESTHICAHIDARFRARARVCVVRAHTDSQRFLKGGAGRGVARILLGNFVRVTAGLAFGNY